MVIFLFLDLNVNAEKIDSFILFQVITKGSHFIDFIFLKFKTI